jgi:hypothetical protein
MSKITVLGLITYNKKELYEWYCIRKEAFGVTEEMLLRRLGYN